MRSTVRAGFQSCGMAIDEAAHSCTMRFVAQDFSFRQEEASLRGEFAALVTAARPVRAELLESVDAAVSRFGEIFRPGDPSVAIRGKVRIVVIEELDANACGGTHVRSTSELGELANLCFEQCDDSFCLTFALAGC